MFLYMADFKNWNKMSKSEKWDLVEKTMPGATADAQAKFVNSDEDPRSRREQIAGEISNTFNPSGARPSINAKASEVLTAPAPKNAAEVLSPPEDQPPTAADFAAKKAEEDALEEYKKKHGGKLPGGISASYLD